MYSYNDFQILKGPRLTLTRLEKNEIEELATSLFSHESWFCNYRGLDSRDKVLKKFQSLYESQNRQERLILVVRYENELLPASTFHSQLVNFWSLEIGFTWIAQKWQRTFVNTE